MVTGTHPDEVDLFEYVEGDLAADRRADLEAHLATCASCAEQIALVQSGKDALRESPLLHLPPRRREAILTSLPSQPRAVGRRLTLSPKRVLAVMTPIAAVAAVAVVLVSSGVLATNGSNDGGGGQAARATSLEQMEDQAGGAEAAAPIMKVAGPAATVADELRRKGLAARVVGNSVEVRDATRAEVQEALKSRRTGRVEIVLVP